MAASKCGYLLALPPPAVRLPSCSHAPLLKLPPNHTASMHCRCRPTREHRLDLLHKAKRRVYKSHSEPRVPIIVYVPGPGEAVVSRDGSFHPSPAQITEPLTRGGLSQSNMSTFRLWQKAFNSGLARSGDLNESFGHIPWAEVGFTVFLAKCFCFLSSFLYSIPPLISLRFIFPHI